MTEAERCCERDPRGGFLRRPFCKMHGREYEGEGRNKAVAYASGRPGVVFRVVVVNSFPLTAPPVDLGGTVAIVVVSAGDRRLGMSIPIWEVRLLVRRRGGLDLWFRLVVPFDTVVRFASTGRRWRGESFIGCRIGGVRWILTE